MMLFVPKLNVGPLEIGVFDVLDIFVVAILLYQLYKLLKGSLAYNIFLGLLLIYLSWLLVRVLEMRLLQAILEQFIGLGVIALLILFQPEVRRFLLYIGKGGKINFKGLINRRFAENLENDEIDEMIDALARLSANRVGALIVIAKTSQLQFFASTGTEMNATLSSKLIQSIFQKNSPLHDGALIISGNKIIAGGCTLPLSENPDLPDGTGLRHRAAAGITENSDALTLIVSEETGHIAISTDGKIITDVDDVYIKAQIQRHFEE